MLVAVTGRFRTVSGMENPIAQLVGTPLIGGLLAHAREAELSSRDQDDRAAAWANWALNNLVTMTGTSARDYVAVQLPGRFYDPKGVGPDVPPHVELPSWALRRADVEFHHRLGQLGNAALFEWWLVPEVTAVRRVLLPVPTGSNAALLRALFDRKGGLVGALQAVSKQAAPQWTVIERLHAARADALVQTVIEPFTSSELEQVFPPAQALGMTISLDPRLVQSSGSWVSRRVGAWRIETRDTTGAAASLGVVTPRLTRNSMFTDPLFDPESESAAALLVRYALLARIMKNHLNGMGASAVALDPAVAARGSYFRSVVAKVGEKLPEASAESAVQLIEAYPVLEDAWAALQVWAGAGHILTVDRDKFADAHRRLSSELRRAGAFDQHDVNVLLPLAWDTKGRVVRVTFVRRRSS